MTVEDSYRWIYTPSRYLWDTIAVEVTFVTLFISNGCSVVIGKVQSPDNFKSNKSKSLNENPTIGSIHGLWIFVDFKASNWYRSHSWRYIVIEQVNFWWVNRKVWLQAHIGYMGVSKNNGTPKSSILIGFSSINHPFWGTPIFGNIHIVKNILLIIPKISEAWMVHWNPTQVESHSTARTAITNSTAFFGRKIIG